MIYTQDHLPPHVHAVGNGSAKIAIDGPIARALVNKGLSGPDIKRALDAVQRERTRLLDLWEDIHGRPDR
jgi:hypothetical protein